MSICGKTRLFAALALHSLLSTWGVQYVSANDGVHLQQRVEALEIELAQIRGAAAFQAPPNQLPSPVPHEPPECLTCPPAEGSQPFEPTIKLGGFFHADWGFVSQDPVNVATVGDIQDAADFRRARLSASGDAWTNAGYMIEFDFAFAGRPTFMDVSLDIRETALGTVRIGQWRQPLGMDGLTSAKELTLMERALPFAFLPFRQVGIGLFDTSADESTTWAVSGFRFPTDAFGSNIGDDGGYAMATRVTHVFARPDDESQLLHTGFGFSFGDPSMDMVRYRSQPEFFVGEAGGAPLVPAGMPTNVPPFVDTGLIATDNFRIVNAEVAATFGSLYTQSELYLTSVEQLGLGEVNFSGAYAQAGYFLTGEVRPYNRTAATYGRLKPHCNFGTHGCGAWEVAARWSYLDLNDANIMGGRLNDVTFGVNWYLNPNTKFQLNYIRACLDNPMFGESEADIVALRGQVDF